MRVVLFPLRPLADLSHRINDWSSRWLDRFINRIYLPALNWSIRLPGVILAIAICLFLVVAGFIRAGVIPFVAFPKLDSRTIEARINFPDGTSGPMTNRATQKLEDALLEVADEAGGKLIKHHYRMAGWTAYPNNATAIGGSFYGGTLGDGKRRAGAT